MRANSPIASNESACRRRSAAAGLRAAAAPVGLAGRPGTRRYFVAGIAAALTCVMACGGTVVPDAPGPHIDSLSELTVERLRWREFGSTIRVEQSRSHDAQHSYLASYDSDGLRLYTRIDVPRPPPPPGGYPVVIFVHGWIGIDAAPSFTFFDDDDSDYAQLIDAFVGEGFVVFSPGLRGHGTVDGVPADGIEFMQAWDNGSYLSPVFYALDVLNLLDGLSSFESAPLDLERINSLSHSQGGDAALIALAIAGEGSSVRNGFHAASFWSATFPPRFTQLETYWPMQTSPEAFLAGDGTWNGTARGSDDSVNERFVFGYPPDWIQTPHPGAWTWQHDTWSAATTAEALTAKLEQMYGAINEYVADTRHATFRLDTAPGRPVRIEHDPAVADAMRRIGGFGAAEYLTEPLALHHSDRDFYSIPAWNADLCRRVNAAGGLCHDFTYPENTHSLRVSPYPWFSGGNAVAGFADALARDVALFRGADPREIEAR